MSDYQIHHCYRDQDGNLYEVIPDAPSRQIDAQTLIQIKQDERDFMYHVHTDELMAHRAVRQMVHDKLMLDRITQAILYLLHRQ